MRSLGVVALALPIVYVSLTTPTVDSTEGSSTPTPSLDRLDADRRGILFRSTVPDATFGKVAFVPLDNLAAAWAVSPISCDRVYFQRGHDVCEILDSSLVPPYAVFVFEKLGRDALLAFGLCKFSADHETSTHEHDAVVA